MSVKVAPWGRGGFQVTIRFRWPDRTVYRDRRVLDVRTETQARKWGEQREREVLAAGQLKPEEKKPKTRIPTVAAFSKDWLEKHGKANLHKQSGQDADESILRVHIIPFIGNLTLDRVTDEMVASLRARWIAGGYETGKRIIKATSSRKTLNNRMSVLSSMLNTAVEWRKVPSMPCRIRLLKVDSQKTPAFHDHETYERLVEGARAVDARILVLVLLAGDGGLRRGECIGLDLTDVDFKNGRFTPRRHVYIKRGVRYVDEVKGDLAKPVPATQRLLDALKAVRHLRGPRVLYTDDGRELTPKLVKLGVMSAERRAGLPETGRLHVFRHTYCSHLAMAGVPVKTVQELARHTTLNVTMRYMHLSPSAKDEGVAMLERSRAEGGVAVARANMVPTTSGK